ncbi:MAG TPA: hypothetical protein VEB20_19395, partial [Azospirillaceae bacterium]|nr:hypothetical protein [Azospirillaceae bacterium]
MDRPNPQRVLNGAASQLDRWRERPQPGRVQVDGRNLSEILAFSAEYGALVNFFDLEDQPDGDWTPLFASDPTIALAMLAGLDVDAWDTRLQRLQALLREAGGAEARAKAARRILALLLRALRVLDRARENPGAAGTGIARTVRHEAAGGIGRPLRALARHLAATRPDQGLRLESAGLSEAWGLAGAAAEGREAGASFSRGWFDRLQALLAELAAALGALLRRLSAEARRLLPASMESDGHAPQAALYIAFARLFGHAQDAVNRFPARLLDFYYSAVLRQVSRAAEGDRLFLAFTPEDGTPVASVPKGTLFPAGTDAAGDSIDFATERALAVYPAPLAALRTLTVAEATVAGMPMPAGLLAGRVTLADKPPLLSGPFPPFGGAAPGTEGPLVTAPATLGFAVAGPVLMLTGGERKVDLLLTVAPASLDALMPALTAIGDAAGGVAPLDVLAQVLAQGFAYSYSTAGGWVPVRDPVVAAPAEGTVFTLGFTLDAGAEPLVAMATQPAAKTAVPPADPASVPTMDLPTVQASLEQAPVTVTGTTAAVPVPPYALLSGLALSGLEVRVDVTDLAQLGLATPTGDADPAKPFAPFGAPPTQHGAVEIAAPELFVKTLSSLSLALTWYGLPQTTTGFKGYYQGYVVDLEGNTVPDDDPLFTNRTFRAAIDVVNPGLWTLGPQEEAPYLFRTSADAVPEPDKPVLPDTAFTGLPVVPAAPP